MADQFRITLAQVNPTVGDISGNVDVAQQICGEARDAGVIWWPFECLATGYNAQDLVMKPAFRLAAMQAVRDLASECADGPAILIRTPWVEAGQLFTYIMPAGGQVRTVGGKHHLPNGNGF